MTAIHTGNTFHSPTYLQWSQGNVPLKVSILSPEEYPLAAQIVKIWGAQAHQMYRHPATSPISDQSIEYLWVANCTQKTLKKPTKDTEVHVCFHKDKPQGVATLSLKGLQCIEEYEEEVKQEDYLYLQDLISNPENLFSTENKHGQIRGAGTALIASSFQRSQELKVKGICVDPTSRAASFL